MMAAKAEGAMADPRPPAAAPLAPVPVPDPALPLAWEAWVVLSFTYTKP